VKSNRRLLQREQTNALPDQVGEAGARALAPNAAISERWAAEDFFREEVSRRISLREMREISSFKTEAMFSMMSA